MSALPTVPSQLIELALGNLRKVEETSGTYVVDMCTWHDPDEASGKCSVCLAGSVMAMTLGMDPAEFLGPGDTDLISRADSMALEALDDLRCGAIWHALAALDLEQPAGLGEGFDVPKYDRASPGPFHQAMHELATQLRAHGL